MKTPLALLALCDGNPRDTDEFPSQRVVMQQSFTVFYDVKLPRSWTDGRMKTIRCSWDITVMLPPPSTSTFTNYILCWSTTCSFSMIVTATSIEWRLCKQACCQRKQEGSEYIPTWFIYLSIHFHVARLFSSLLKIHTHASRCCFADHAAFNPGTSPHARQRHQIIIQHPAKAIPMLPKVIR